MRRAAGHPSGPAAGGVWHTRRTRWLSSSPSFHAPLGAPDGRRSLHLGHLQRDGRGGPHATPTERGPACGEAAVPRRSPRRNLCSLSAAPVIYWRFRLQSVRQNHRAHFLLLAVPPPPRRSAHLVQTTIKTHLQRGAGARNAPGYPRVTGGRAAPGLLQPPKPSSSFPGVWGMYFGAEIGIPSSRTPPGRPREGFSSKGDNPRPEFWALKTND